MKRTQLHTALAVGWGSTAHYLGNRLRSSALRAELMLWDRFRGMWRDLSMCGVHLCTQPSLDQLNVQMLHMSRVAEAMDRRFGEQAHTGGKGKT